MSIDPNGRLIMSDSIHETAATPSVSLAAVVKRTLLFVCVALCVCAAPCACAGRSVFFFKQKTAYEIGVRLVGSEMCIRDRPGILYVLGIILS